jgi:hypothetical protein
MLRHKLKTLESTCDLEENVGFHWRFDLLDDARRLIIVHLKTIMKQSLF